MLQLDENYLVQAVTATVGLLTALALGIQAWLKKSRETDSEHSLIKLMHTELERMSKQNSVLSEEIGNLQQELIKLNSQLNTLSAENQKLRLEVSNLNTEIIRLHGIVDRKGNDYGNTR